jgi:hypothetical protein
LKRFQRKLLVIPGDGGLKIELPGEDASPPETDKDRNQPNHAVLPSPANLLAGTAECSVLPPHDRTDTDSIEDERLAAAASGQFVGTQLARTLEQRTSPSPWIMHDGPTPSPYLQQFFSVFVSAPRRASFRASKAKRRDTARSSLNGC